MSKYTLEDFFDMPIAYHRCFVVFVGVTGAVFMSQAIYWSKRTKDEEGWFYKTQEEWEIETGLTRREQETARKRAKEAGLLEEKLAGNPARMYYRINLEPILKQLEGFSMAESAKQDCTIPPNKNGGNEQTIYTEITTENTNNNKVSNSPLDDMLKARKVRKAKKQPFGWSGFVGSRPNLTPKPVKKGSHAEDVI